MSAPARPLNFVDHGKVKIKPSRHFPHVENEQIVPLIVHEFASAAAEMPVVFVKNAETGEFTPVAIMGFETGENVFHGETWRGSYVPAVVMHHPFALMPSKEDPEQLQLILIETDEVLNGTEGEALFTESGEESKYLASRKEALGKYFEHTHVTKSFVNFLTEKDLLVEQTLNLEINGQKRQLSGVYLINESKLNALSDEDFLTLRKRGFLSPIYAHFFSIQQLSNLARLKSTKA
ncbi:SapC family protein [Thalassotalea sp. M1531]|uniref:SapC family protein n=1 Tax=Thalassotalea algicola TaxID=2716224 RepID=A0A7Y0L963_9GAMM|nr:SapC family protein [Thalassotalea algicola]NMP30279.1 SapC family protein [Thalassotalea algicola]